MLLLCAESADRRAEAGEKRSAMQINVCRILPSYGIYSSSLLRAPVHSARACTLYRAQYRSGIFESGQHGSLTNAYLEIRLHDLVCQLISFLVSLSLALLPPARVCAAAFGVREAATIDGETQKPKIRMCAVSALR